MECFNNIDFSITNCDVSDIISEGNRFMFHVALVHIVTHVIDGKDELFGHQTIKTLFITAIAILSYHILFKKLVDPKLKKIQYICKNPKKKHKEKNKLIDND